MPISSAALRAMFAAGASPDVIIAAVEAEEAAEREQLKKKRVQEAERQQRKRNRDKTPSDPRPCHPRSGNPRLPLLSVTRDSTDVTPVTRDSPIPLPFPPAPPLTNPLTPLDDDDDRCALAFLLADQVAAIIGVDRDNPPSGWRGLEDYLGHRLREGFGADVIRAAARKAAAVFAKRTEPHPETCGYLTRLIGQQHEDLQRRQLAIVGSVGAASSPSANTAFDEFWNVRIERDGPDPREPARIAFNEAVGQGADPQAIIAGMRRFAEAHADSRGTRFLSRTEKWLREKTWQDYQQAAAPVASSGQVWLHADDDRYRAWDAHRRATTGRGLPTDARGGWYLPSEWPPGHKETAA